MTGKMFRGKKSDREELKKRLDVIHYDSVKHGVTGEQFKELFLSDHNENTENNNIKAREKEPRKKRNYCVTTGVCLVVAVAITFSYVFEVRSVEDMRTFIETTECLISNNEIMTEMARPKYNCKLCESIREVPIERNISQVLFKERYAYSAVPVLVKDATKDWSAMTIFSFQFFKDLYQNTEGALQNIEDECQFFPYKTEFKSLGDVFNMSDDRASFAEGEKPWYIGWSNCHELVKKKLRQHYRKPYFLPDNSESSQLDWMFMGGTGPGAFIHIDFVQKSSWQAQITGKKTWRLLPSPECEHVCHEMNVTVHKGDIFVIDTNKWFHSTFIHPGEISITIGSEYD